MRDRSRCEQLKRRSGDLIDEFQITSMQRISSIGEEIGKARGMKNVHVDYREDFRSRRYEAAITLSRGEQVKEAWNKYSKRRTASVPLTTNFRR